MDNSTNDTIEYRIFEGRSYLELMPRLFRAGFRPATFPEGMRLMARAVNSDNESDISQLVDNYIDTGDGLVRFADEFIIATSAEQLRYGNLNRAVDGEIALTPEEYSDLSGIKLSRDELEKAGVNRDLTMWEAMNHIGWLARAGGDRELLAEFIGAVFGYVRSKHGYKTTMSFYLPERSNSPLIRAGFISYPAWRWTPGNYGLLTNPGRILGIREKNQDDSS